MYEFMKTALIYFNVKLWCCEARSFHEEVECTRQMSPLLQVQKCRKNAKLWNTKIPSLVIKKNPMSSKRRYAGTYTNVSRYKFKWLSWYYIHVCL